MEIQSENNDIEYYREKIVDMVNEIKNKIFLEKIYNYIIVPYNMWQKEKQRD